MVKDRENKDTILVCTEDEGVYTWKTTEGIEIISSPEKFPYQNNMLFALCASLSASMYPSNNETTELYLYTWRLRSNTFVSQKVKPQAWPPRDVERDL